MKCETMNLDLVRTFVITVQAGSYKEASLRMGIDLSNISRHIKTLEEVLQTKLLQRIQGKVVLTEAGEIIYKEYEKAYNLLFLAEKKMLQKKSLDSGKISIGCVDGLDTTYLFDYIQKFSIQYPSVKIKIVNGSDKDIYKQLEQYSLDLIFGYDNGEEETNIEIKNKVLFQSNYCFVYNPKFFASDFNLEEVPIIAPTTNTSRNVLNEYAKNNNLNLNIKYELQNDEHIVDYVEKGLGVGFVFKELANNDNLKTLIIPNIKPLNIKVSYVKNNLSESVKAFLNILDKN